MADKEERILIARSSDYTLTDTDKGELFEGKIAPHCANVYTRQEAIEKILKAICGKNRLERCYKCSYKDTEKCIKFCKDNYIEQAEAALNALLEGVKK